MVKILKKIWFWWITPMVWCEYCGQLCYVKIRRQNTQYADDEMNYVTCCNSAYEEIQEYWAERWSDYWSMVL